jgi:sulfite reductase beta subunit-like hemoprotein
MLRVKVPAGQLSPGKLRTVGEVSNRYGRGDGELSTNRTSRCWLELAKLPEVFADLGPAG